MRRAGTSGLAERKRLQKRAREREAPSERKRARATLQQHPLRAASNLSSLSLFSHLLSISPPPPRFCSSPAISIEESTRLDSPRGYECGQGPGSWGLCSLFSSFFFFLPPQRRRAMPQRERKEKKLLSFLRSLLSSYLAHEQARLRLVHVRVQHLRPQFAPFPREFRSPASHIAATGSQACVQTRGFRLGAQSPLTVDCEAAVSAAGGGGEDRPEGTSRGQLLSPRGIPGTRLCEQTS